MSLLPRYPPDLPDLSLSAASPWHNETATGCGGKTRFPRENIEALWIFRENV